MTIAFWCVLAAGDPVRPGHASGALAHLLCHYKKYRLRTVLRGRGLAVVSRLGLFQRPASVLSR